MKNRILAIIAGLVIGWVIVGLGDVVTHKLFPAPTDFDYTDKQALKTFIEGLPVAAFVSMILVWAISAFLGGMTTGKIAKSNWKRLCLITGGILLLANVANMFVIPHPTWVNIVTVIMYLPLAYLGGKIIQKAKNES